MSVAGEVGDRVLGGVIRGGALSSLRLAIPEVSRVYKSGQLIKSIRW